MIYNQDDEENFLSDKRVEEVYSNNTQPRRRGGAYLEEKQENKIQKQNRDENEESNVFNTVVIVVALIVAVIAVFVLLKVFSGNKPKDNVDKTDTNVSTTTDKTTNNTENDTSKKDKDTTSSSSNPSKNKTLAIQSVNDTYNAYKVEIESVVHVKGGNFYNNTEKIKGDKAYVEYKQISGLKDKEKEKKINAKLKDLVVELYDKNYLKDKDTLFIDIHTKLSVNFNTLSYLVIKTYEDIDGNRKNEKAVSYNIRLDNLEEIKFEELFVDNANIKGMYSGYVKGKVDTFYYDPKTIYIYSKDLKETTIDMSKNYSDIAIYNRYKESKNIFESSATSKKVFTVLESTVSQETKNRDFQENTITKKTN